MPAKIEHDSDSSSNSNAPNDDDADDTDGNSDTGDIKNSNGSGKRKHSKCKHPNNMLYLYKLASYKCYCTASFISATAKAQCLRHCVCLCEQRPEH
jgi:hypothetical protein